MWPPHVSGEGREAHQGGYRNKKLRGREPRAANERGKGEGKAGDKENKQVSNVAGTVTGSRHA